MINWIYKGTELIEIPDKAFGYIYMITCLENNKKYIGKKFFQTKRRKKVTGKKRKKVVTKESNWREYKSSCIPLQQEIERLGVDKFKFEILCIADTKGQINFLEMYFQFKYAVLTETLPDGSRMYYNDCIGSGKYRNVKFSPEVIQMMHCSV